jgi:hypothetical protein
MTVPTQSYSLSRQCEGRPIWLGRPDDAGSATGPGECGRFSVLCEIRLIAKSERSILCPWSVGTARAAGTESQKVAQLHGRRPLSGQAHHRSQDGEGLFGQLVTSGRLGPILTATRPASNRPSPLGQRAGTRAEGQLPSLHSFPPISVSPASRFRSVASLYPFDQFSGNRAAFSRPSLKASRPHGRTR